MAEDDGVSLSTRFAKELPIRLIASSNISSSPFIPTTKDDEVSMPVASVYGLPDSPIASSENTSTPSILNHVLFKDDSLSLSMISPPCELPDITSGPSVPNHVPLEDDSLSSDESSDPTSGHSVPNRVPFKDYSVSLSMMFPSYDWSDMTSGPSVSNHVPLTEDVSGHASIFKAAAVNMLVDPVDGLSEWLAASKAGTSLPGPLPMPAVLSTIRASLIPERSMVRYHRSFSDSFEHGMGNSRVNTQNNLIPSVSSLAEEMHHYRDNHDTEFLVFVEASKSIKRSVKPPESDETTYFKLACRIYLSYIIAKEKSFTTSQGDSGSQIQIRDRDLEWARTHLSNKTKLWIKYKYSEMVASTQHNMMQVDQGVPQQNETPSFSAFDTQEQAVTSQSEQSMTLSFRPAPREHIESLRSTVSTSSTAKTIKSEGIKTEKERKVSEFTPPSVINDKDLSDDEQNSRAYPKKLRLFSGELRRRALDAYGQSSGPAGGHGQLGRGSGRGRGRGRGRGHDKQINSIHEQSHNSLPHTNMASAKGTKRNRSNSTAAKKVKVESNEDDYPSETEGKHDFDYVDADDSDEDPGEYDENKYFLIPGHAKRRKAA